MAQMKIIKRQVKVRLAQIAKSTGFEVEKHTKNRLANLKMGVSHKNKFIRMSTQKNTD